MTHIVTYTGRCVDPFRLQRDDIDAVDIAHSLAMLCRFNGHCNVFYSVAEHSLLVASLVAPEFRLHALLHDASEAYLSDVTTPVKDELPYYQIVEAEAQRRILEHFGAAWHNKRAQDAVKHADRRALATEKRDLMHDDGTNWALLEGVAPAPDRVRGLVPHEARAEFLNALLDELA